MCTSLLIWAFTTATCKSTVCLAETGRGHRQGPTTTHSWGRLATDGRETEGGTRDHHLNTTDGVGEGRSPDAWLLRGASGEALARGQRLDYWRGRGGVAGNVYSLTSGTSDEVVCGGYTHCTHHAGGQLLQEVTTRGVRDESRGAAMGLIGAPERVADGGCR